MLPGTAAEHRVLANPMEDLVGQHQPWAHRVFHEYRRQLGRRYGSARELEHRQSIFVHNMRYGWGREGCWRSEGRRQGQLAPSPPCAGSCTRGTAPRCPTRWP